MLFKEIIAINSENYKKQTNALCGLYDADLFKIKTAVKILTA
jgi:hypothetical protein